MKARRNSGFLFCHKDTILPLSLKDTKIIHHCVPGHSPSMHLYNFATFNFINFCSAGISPKTFEALAESTFQETPEQVRGLGSLDRARGERQYAEKFATRTQHVTTWKKS